MKAPRITGALFLSYQGLMLDYQMLLLINTLDLTV
ncbi:hypothetical protein SAMN05428988_5832 [Chitinophaga sp. YR573]|nr:hypothetical protein SAMN05428988_5832 [Chitinophaga sp. YR573]